MSFSAGVYTLPTPALVPGQTVSSSENNTVRNDMAASFNLTWLRNGTAAATANIPMGSYKLTGLGAATTSGDALSYGNAAVVTTLTSTSLTATRVPYAGTGGLLQDASTFTFDGTTLTAGGFSGPHNGTVGATTPNTGAFTTLSASSTVSGTGFSTYLASPPAIGGTAAAAGSFTTLTTSSTVTVNGGTANGVAYLNGSKVLTTGSALTFDGTNFATTGTASATKLIPTGGSATGNGMYLPASNTLAWSNNGSETMRLDSSGNLGLGVTPSAWSTGKGLEVGFAGDALWTTAANDIVFTSNAYYNSGWKYGGNSYATRYDNGGGAGKHIWYTAPSGTAGNAITFTQAMTLDASGNLGIGTSSVTGKLHVLSTGGSTSYTNPHINLQNNNQANGDKALCLTSFRTSGGSGYSPVAFGGIQTDNSNRYGAFAVYVSSSDNVDLSTQERMRIDSSGNVGIGTSSPSYKLDVIDTARINASANGNDAALYLRSGSTSGTLQQILFQMAGSGGDVRIQASNENNWLRFTTAGSERMRIDSSGKVLVGTSTSITTNNGESPFVQTAGTDSRWSYQAATFANSASTQGGLFLAKSRGTSVGSYTAVQSGDYLGRIGWSGADGTTMSSQAAEISAQVDGTVSTGVVPGRLVFSTSNTSGVSTERMRIDSSGYLLVGYTSSNGAYKLQVNSQIFATNATIATSDGRYKENVQPVYDALKVIDALNPVTFNWKQHPVHAFDTQTPAIGFIAQEVQQALVDKPYLDSIVKSNEVTLPNETKEEFLGLAEGALIPVLVKALQELKAELDATKAEVAALKGA